MGEQTLRVAKEQEEAVSQAVLKKTYELMTAAFSLVAALAWNDAIQALFLKIFGPSSTVTAKFLYAALVTVLIVWMGSKLAKINKAVEKKLIKKENEVAQEAKQ